MEAVKVGSALSGNMYFRGVLDKTLAQMNGVAWKLSRVPAGPEEEDVVESLRLKNPELMGPTEANSFRYEGGVQYGGDGGLLRHNGSGCCVYSGMGQYQGQWVDGQCHGLGVYTGNAGDQYMGQWDAGVRHGIGAAWSADGDWYRGEFKDDAMTGLGEVRWADGRVHRGTFKKGTLALVATSEPHNAAVDKIVAEASSVYRAAMAARGSAIIAQQQGVSESIRAVVDERMHARTGGLEASVYAAEQEAAGSELARTGKAQREARVAAKCTSAHDELNTVEERVFAARGAVFEGYDRTKQLVEMFKHAVDVSKRRIQALKKEVRHAERLLHDVRRVHYNEKLREREDLTRLEALAFGHAQHNLEDPGERPTSPLSATSAESRAATPNANYLSPPLALSSEDNDGDDMWSPLAARRRPHHIQSMPSTASSEGTVPPMEPLVGRHVGNSFGKTWSQLPLPSSPSSTPPRQPSLKELATIDSALNRARDAKYFTKANTGRRYRARVHREAAGRPAPLPPTGKRRNLLLAPSTDSQPPPPPSMWRKLRNAFKRRPKSPPPPAPVVDDTPTNRVNHRRLRYRAKAKAAEQFAKGQLGDVDTWRPRSRTRHHRVLSPVAAPSVSPVASPRARQHRPSIVDPAAVAEFLEPPISALDDDNALLEAARTTVAI